MIMKKGNIFKFQGKIIMMIAIFLLGMTSATYAIDSEDTHMSESSIENQAPEYYTEEYQKFVRDHNEIVEEYIKLKDLIQMRSSTGGVDLRVPLIMQENSYYCGPASVQMAVDYLTNGRSPSQDRIYDEVRTGPDQRGSIVWKVSRYMSKHNSNYDYFNVNDVNFNRYIRYSLDKGYPVIAQVYASSLPGKSGAGKGHFVTIKGYDYGWGGSQYNDDVIYNDPHYKREYFGTDQIPIESMERAIKDYAGFFISI